MDLSDLEPHERLAFAGLVRMLTRQDGKVTPEEASAITNLSKAAGSQQFWAAMNQAGECLPTPADVSKAAADVTRPEVRRWAYDHLVVLAESDGVDVSEQSLLMWLAGAWSLD